MPDSATCNCCGQQVEIGPDESGDWLGGLCKFNGVELKIPRGVWFQNPETEIFDFIKKIDGKLPEDTLDWEVDEEKVKKYEKQFGPEGMLFSAADFIDDTIKNMGITREQWKDRYKQKLGENKYIIPDPLLLLAIARNFWRNYRDAVAIHDPSGKKIVFGFEQLLELNKLDNLLRAGKITKEERDLRAKQIYATGRDDSKKKMEDQLELLKEQFEKGRIPKEIYDAKVNEILSKILNG
ncbi:Uncharacterised protein [uncultured archaeon]|nr:Uncharacterised protein [uncultured archaeon]